MDLNNFILDNDSSEDENQIEQEISKIDIYIKQRNGRKSITIIEGLNQDKIHLKKIAKDLLRYNKDDCLAVLRLARKIGNSTNEESL